MGCRVLIFLLLFFHTLFGGNNYKQVVYQHTPHGDPIPRILPVLFRPYPVLISPDRYRLYLLTEIMYDYLQFTYNENQFIASIEMEVALSEKNSEAIYSRTWQAKLQVEHFRDTNRRDKFFLTLDSLEAPPGNYLVTVKYRDLQGEQRESFNHDMRLRQVKKFYASPPLFCDLSDSINTGIPFLPFRPIVLRDQLPFNKKMGLYLRFWQEEKNPVQIRVKILKSDTAKILYSTDTLLTPTRQYGNLLITPPFPKWEEGEYQLHIRYRTGKDSLTQNLVFKLIWFDKPRSLWNLSYAIKPLLFILPKGNAKNINIRDKKLQLRKFFEYWLKQDPTPETAYNELMAEFYSRVDSADTRWGKKGRFGWRTDPGRIYLLYGEPDRIEDHSLDPMHPNMKWIYIKPDRTLIFTFRALEGRKRYKLIEEREELRE